MVNVDTVYKTVLYILNKEQRGYITPDEFNRLGTQVQLEIFEQYFEELNQQLRIPQTNNEYANRIKNLEEKIDVFKTFATSTTAAPNNVTYVTAVPPVPAYFSLPENLHRLGTLIYNEKEIQGVDRNQYFLINKSPLTKPTESNPLYVLEGTGSPSAAPSLAYVYPDSIVSGVSAYYVKTPVSPVWGYTVALPSGAYIYDPGAASTQFELHPSEQVNIILNILMYSGIIIRDPQIVQTAATMIQHDEALEKQ
tara:strand:- start:42 stop:797 length:756 start_codon:yes stop_codon:yes gene_type:complete